MDPFTELKSNTGEYVQWQNTDPYVVKSYHTGNSHKGFKDTSPNALRGASSLNDDSHYGFDDHEPNFGGHKHREADILMKALVRNDSYWDQTSAYSQQDRKQSTFKRFLEDQITYH
jgi:hypothetical protein